MPITLIRGNALDLPLADNSVDLIVTSPPYFALRSYQDEGEHYDGQLGSEATPTDFLVTLLAATREMMRVTKPTGSIWVNLGDKYGGGSNTRDNLAAWSKDNARGGGKTAAQARPRRPIAPVDGMRPKSLIGLPWRYAIACMDVLGLILRAEVIWSKPNGIPESVRDRVRRSHDTWFHFTLSPRYYSATDEIRERTGREMSWETYEKQRGKSWHDHSHDAERGMTDLPDKPPVGVHPLGRSMGSVWTVPPQALTVPPEIGVDHYATFPMELPRRIIRGWSPSGICTVCGEGRRPLVDVQYDNWVDAGPKTKQSRIDEPGRVLSYASGMSATRRTTIIGEECGCENADAPTEPAVVLDPFGGTGTTALVASVLGRHGISVDLSADYNRLAEWRTNDPGQIATAMEVKRPEAPMPGQLGFELDWETG